jgi:hypothetical protein
VYKRGTNNLLTWKLTPCFITHNILYSFASPNNCNRHEFKFCFFIPIESHIDKE